ncbi:hypothetical protein N7492_000117 [Penicillium capsulatum]|uniref:Uncharacterized protein n=1 Tax=Penicillium capsulatum TaxID=69766 RepID=A0A9W9LY87_9EURO|nr:hypothetical protein N7492_000117 [Penicillium capsulatum]
MDTLSPIQVIVLTHTLIDFDSIIAYDPEFACNKTVKSYIIDSQQSIDSQHSGKTVNQLQICTDFLKSVYKQSGEACNKWCWKRIAEALKNKKQAPIDGAEELATTLFFSLLFTTTKDTKVVVGTNSSSNSEPRDTDDVE